MTHTDPQYRDDNCVFCKIIAGEIPAVKVYEDDETFAFLDIKPVHPGHTLVIPKDHYENIYSVPPELWARMALTSQKIALAVRQAVDADGINIHVNNEPTAGQLVFHSHIHIIPRFEHDGLNHWSGNPETTREQLEEVQNKLTAILKADN